MTETGWALYLSQLTATPERRVSNGADLAKLLKSPSMIAVKLLYLSGQLLLLLRGQGAVKGNHPINRHVDDLIHLGPVLGNHGF